MPCIRSGPSAPCAPGPRRLRGAPPPRYGVRVARVSGLTQACLAGDALTAAAHSDASGFRAAAYSIETWAAQHKSVGAYACDCASGFQGEVRRAYRRAIDVY